MSVGVGKLRWLLALAAGGCGGEETGLAPLEQPEAGEGGVVEAGPDAPLPPPVEAGTRLRTVERRNPFGRAGFGNNLLVDGDFELTAGGGQYGWRALTSSGEASLSRETGGLCRSGVVCGVLEADVSLVAFGAAPRDQTMQASLWAKPSGGDCYSVGVALIDCSSTWQLSLAQVAPVALEPDDGGWCHYLGLAPPMQSQPCLYVTALAEAGRVLVDEAYLASADGAGSPRVAATVPEAALAGRIARDVDWLIRNRRFGRARTARP